MARSKSPPPTPPAVTGADFPANGLAPMHPGEFLGKEVLPALGKSKTEIARSLGIGRVTLYNLLDGDAALTADMALRVAKLTGTDPMFWMTLQDRYELATAAPRLEAELAAIPRLQPAAPA